jgi:glycosyltransferase involved in cell wall biosynthesis
LRDFMNDSMIKICYTVDSRYAGGAERYVSLLAAGLDREIFEPHVLAREGSGLDVWCGEMRSGGIPVTRLPMDMPFRPAHAIPVGRALSKLAPHIVHINAPGPYDGQMGLLAPLARYAGATRVIVTEHLPRVEWLWKRALIKQIAYQWVDGVVTICRSNIQPLIERQHVAREMIEVVYNGVDAGYGNGRDVIRDTVRAELELGSSEVGIVFLGSLIERKGIGTLFDALALLAAAGQTQWRLFVIGDGDDSHVYSLRADENGLRDRIRFMGSRSAGEVERFLCGVDLLVVPSFMEGMPYVILEAMACSLPVVASRIDGIPEATVDGNTGLLVPPGDPRALGAAIGRFLEDSDSRNEAGRNGRRRFEALFTLDRHISRMERLYLGLLEGGKQTARTDAAGERRPAG